ncbi:MAG TPA: hypothetical protein PKD86_14450 [Gemmatales bacterium]|nr:hypothetical protein [Gemmatales bacterium]HMP60544.1 hypothetical protein [Gemmatales bacterium]
MTEPTDFRFELNARRYMRAPMIVYLAGLFLAVGLTWALPALWDDADWVRGLSFFGVFILLGLGWYGAILLRGGTYRVEVRGGRLRVESPALWSFGPSFDVALDSIQRLHVSYPHDGDGNEFKVETTSGTFDVHAECGRELFAALRRLRPEMPP